MAESGWPKTSSSIPSITTVLQPLPGPNCWRQSEKKDWEATCKREISNAKSQIGAVWPVMVEMCITRGCFLFCPVSIKKRLKWGSVQVPENQELGKQWEGFFQEYTKAWMSALLLWHDWNEILLLLFGYGSNGRDGLIEGTVLSISRLMNGSLLVCDVSIVWRHAVELVRRNNLTYSAERSLQRLSKYLERFIDLCKYGNPRPCK